MFLGIFIAVYSTLQFRNVLRTLKPAEIPEGYWASLGIICNLLVATLGIILTVNFFLGS